MFHHAEAYIKAIGVGDHVPHAAGEPCALCQQPLSEEAAARMLSFHEFLVDSATTEAEAAQSAYITHCQLFEDTEIEAPVQFLSPLTELSRDTPD
jgi:hypothetical protein